MAINRGMRLVVVVVMTLTAVNVCQGYKFYVGGREGWGVNPSEPEGYNHWAERNRFQVNDTLLFKKKKAGGEESVLVVTRDNYIKCYTERPLQNLTGDAEFKFSRSGPHYFISGKEDHCKQGQRLIVVVLAVRPPPPPSPAEPVPVPQPPKTNVAVKTAAGSIACALFALLFLLVTFF